MCIVGMANSLHLSLVFSAVAVTGLAQTPGDYERRIAELEAKMQALEQKLSALFPPPPAAAPVSVAVTSIAPVRAPLSMPIVPVSVSGDYKSAPNSETQLPVAGYMDFHVNKEEGDSFRPDFHRFVLLFGHSFSDRIKFWSELELEHSILEPSEGSGGELELEQAYLDFFIKPYFNLRAGMVLSPIGIVNERHEPPSFNGVERPFVETKIIPRRGANSAGDLGRGFVIGAI